MANYGIRITDDSGKQIVLDGSMRYASFLGNASLNNGGGSVGVDRPLRGSATPFILPRNLVYVAPSAVNPSGPAMAIVTGMSFDGNTLSYSTQSFGASNNAFNIGSADMLSIQHAESQGGYGIRITNGSNFMEISDQSYVGVVSYRATVNISSWWAVPQEIVNLGNYAVFARWSNTDTPLFFDRAGNGISTWGGFGSNNGAVQGGTVNNVQIVIVSFGFTLTKPGSSYGLVIRNASGQITYSSKYPPVAWPDAYYSMPGYLNYGDQSGDRVNWVSPTGSVSNPMVPLCTLGFGRGDFNRSSGNYNFRRGLLTGLKMSGNQVTTSRCKPVGDMEVYNRPSDGCAGAKLPCLEASYYF